MLLRQRMASMKILNKKVASKTANALSDEMDEFYLNLITLEYSLGLSFLLKI
jgi:hypothetical protein